MKYTFDQVVDACSYISRLDWGGSLGRERAIRFLWSSLDPVKRKVIPSRLNPENIRDLEDIQLALDYLLDNEVFYGANKHMSCAIDIHEDIMDSYYDDFRSTLK